VTVTMPDPGKRFISMQFIDEDHYVPAVYYGPRVHVLTRQNIGTRYVVVGIRTLVDPGDSKDLEEVHRLQDAIKISQKEVGKLELPNWDQASLKDVREALLVLAKYTAGFSRAFGTKDKVDPVRHLIGTAAGWGGDPDRDATYISAAAPQNDGANRLQASGQRRTGRRLLVGQRLQRRRLFREELIRRLHPEQHHRKERPGRHRHNSIRRLRRKNSELLADHAGMELYRATIPPARRNPERQVEIPRSATSQLNVCLLHDPDLRRCLT